MTLDDLELHKSEFFREFLGISQILDTTAAKRMNIGQYCQRQRCKHVELEQFWQAFASRGFVSDSWAFLYYHYLEGFLPEKPDRSGFSGKNGCSTCSEFVMIA